MKKKVSDLDESATGWRWLLRTVIIKGKVSIQLNCKNIEKRLLPEVYYIPSLCNNIISLGQFHSQANVSAEVVLELIRADICGPFTPPILASNKLIFFYY